MSEEDLPAWESRRLSREECERMVADGKLPETVLEYDFTHDVYLQEFVDYAGHVFRGNVLLSERAPEWTKTPPTDPGFYWARYVGDYPPALEHYGDGPVILQLRRRSTPEWDEWLECGWDVSLDEENYEFYPVRLEPPR